MYAGEILAGQLKSLVTLCMGRSRARMMRPMHDVGCMFERIARNEWMQKRAWRVCENEQREREQRKRKGKAHSMNDGRFKHGGKAQRQRDAKQGSVYAPHPYDSTVAL